MSTTVYVALCVVWSVWGFTLGFLAGDKLREYLCRR